MQQHCICSSIHTASPPTSAGGRITLKLNARSGSRSLRSGGTVVSGDDALAATAVTPKQLSPKTT
jgi:hypothetical protein